jgi:hypothetical protein
MEDEAMSGETKKPGAAMAPDRRDFLKALTGAGAIAAAAVTITEVAEAQSSTDRESRDERVKARYQPDSPHVQAFYRTNRY